MIRFCIIILLILSIKHAYSELKTSRVIKYPENYGVVYGVEHYNKLLKENNYIEVSKRGKNFVSYCKEEMAENKSCRDEIVRDECDGIKIISSGNINYCTEVRNDTLTIDLDFRVYFRHYDKNKKNIMPREAKNMFYSALNCMKSIYSQYGLNLNLNVSESKNDQTFDMMVIDGVTMQQEMHLISLGKDDHYFDHETLCQLVTHEVSHHLGLPDRYKMKMCPLVVEYPLGSMMSSKKEQGYEGISIIEDDFFDIFGHGCPNTVKSFSEHKDVVCPPVIETAPMPPEETHFFKKISETLKSLYDLF